MAGYANLPDIDGDLDSMPEEYRAYIASQYTTSHDNNSQLNSVPAYREHDYGAYGASEDEYWGEKTTHFDHHRFAAEYNNNNAAATAASPQYTERRYSRYATPELENQEHGGGQRDESFDGPEEYQSTVDEVHDAAPQRSRTFGRFLRRGDTKAAKRSDDRAEMRAAATAAIKERSRNTNKADGQLRNKEISEKSLSSLASDDSTATAPEQPHFGPVPTTQRRRNVNKKLVSLTAGNLVLDAPIPSRLSSFLPRKGQEEFDKMRYTACTSDVSPGFPHYESWHLNHVTSKPRLKRARAILFFCRSRVAHCSPTTSSRISTA